MTFPELNRDKRGHDFYPSDAERATYPDLYETEDVPLESKQIVAHFFTRGGVGEWWVVELERGNETALTAFGFADLGYREAGYFDLVALESLRIERAGQPDIVIERDLHWTPRPWSDVQ